MVPTIALAQANFWQTTGGPKAGIVKSLAINSKGHIFAVPDAGAYYNGVYRSTDNGSTWTQLSNSISTLITSIAIIPGDYIVGGAYKAIYLSTDNGDTWQKRKDVYHGYNFYSVTSFTVTPDSFVYAGTQGDGLYYSDNLGFSWYGGTDVGDNFVHSLTTSAKGYLFVGTDYAILRQNYNGSAWGGAHYPWLYGGPGDVVSLLSTRKGYVFASTDYYGVLRSTEDSVFFSPVTNGLLTSGRFVLSANSAGDIFAGNDSSGMYRSTNNGNTWTRINSGLATLNVYSLAVSPNGYLFAGASDGVVYRSTQPTTAIERTGSEMPLAFSLEQNYPNPFNPSTTIEFSLSHSGPVTVKVFNLLGEEVATLVNEVRPAGTYRIGWNAGGLPSGVYFYRLQASNLTEAKKLTLLR